MLRPERSRPNPHTAAGKPAWRSPTLFLNRANPNLYNRMLRSGVFSLQVKSLGGGALRSEQPGENRAGITCGARAGWFAGVQWMRLLQVLLDAVIVGGAVAAAFLIRFDGKLNPVFVHQLLVFIPVLVPLRLAANWLCGV